jgi:hypothetical protein
VYSFDSGFGGSIENLKSLEGGDGLKIKLQQGTYKKYGLFSRHLHPSPPLPPLPLAVINVLSLNPL